MLDFVFVAGIAMNDVPGAFVCFRFGFFFGERLRQHPHHFGWFTFGGSADALCRWRNIQPKPFEERLRREVQLRENLERVFQFGFIRCEVLVLFIIRTIIVHEN